MRTKSDTHLFLEQVECIDAIIPNKLIEIQQWYDLATSITATMQSECVQSSGSKQKMADAVVKCLDTVDEITDYVDQLRKQKKVVTQTIEKLYSPTEYKLLHLRYIQYIPLEDIAEMWDVPYTNITSAHNRAVKHVQAILNKCKAAAE